MKLFEADEFEEAITQAHAHFADKGMNLSEQFIEKDYYLTEALRLIAANFTGQIIFKGGTSLSKGWGLIERFSEDADIFLDPQAFEPALGKNGINRTLKLMRDTVAAHPGLTYLEAKGGTVGGFGRNDYFGYVPHFGGVAAVAPHIFIEAGTASGRQPTEDVQLESYLAAFLRETGVSLGAEDEESFEMRLLHFRRTFVEKLFAIHRYVEACKTSGEPLGSPARHYYDLYRLARTSEVREMLGSSEYADIKADYETVTLAAFPNSYVRPEGMSFANSSALFPAGALGDMIARAYTEQCDRLCFGAVPAWSQVAQTFEGLRPLL
jgi:hypothetical protein